MNILFVRHGESVSSSEDPRQPLSKKGRKEVKLFGEFLQVQELEFDYILHSKKLRAKETAEIICEILCLDIPIEEREYLSPLEPVSPLIQEIAKRAGNGLVIGHLPFLEKCITYLLFNEEKEGILKLRPATGVLLEHAVHEGFQLEWLVSPGLLSSDFQCIK